MPVLPNITTSDDYTHNSTLSCPSAVRARVLVRNATIMIQYGYGGRGGSVSFTGEPERPVYPGNYSFDESERPFDAIRVRSFTPGVPAQVIVDVVTDPRRRHG